VWAQLDREGLGEQHDRALGAIVPGQAGARSHAGGGADVDEAAAAANIFIKLRLEYMPFVIIDSPLNKYRKPY
jgi:uncharacterized MAPEG superfamily protein